MKLITGADGFVGRHLVKARREDGLINPGRWIDRLVHFDQALCAPMAHRIVEVVGKISIQSQGQGRWPAVSI